MKLLLVISLIGFVSYSITAIGSIFYIGKELDDKYSENYTQEEEL